jgi:hypothetical protein
MPIKRTKSEKKKPRYIKVGKLKLSQEEWETQTALADYFKPSKIEVKLIEAKKPIEIKLVEVKPTDKNEKIKLVEKKEEEP